jgi:hypothetical protein
VQSSGAIINPDGAFCALADSPFGTNTAVVFSFAAANSTATGIWFWSEFNALTAATPNDTGAGDLNSDVFTVHNPSNSASTTPPTLTSSNLVNGGDSTDILFNYDKPVNLGAFANCFILTSDSSFISAVGEAQFDADTLQVTFPPGAQTIMEEVVGVNDDSGPTLGGGCANSTTPGVISTKGGVKAGGNDGAFSYGYTTGAEAQSLTVDRATNRVFVTLDQRIIGTTGAAPNIVLANIRLIGPDGSPGASPNSATVPSQGPGPQVLTLQFGAGQIPAGTFGVQLLASAVSTPGPVGAYTGQTANQPQVFALN